MSTENLQPIREHKVSPDLNQSKDWIDVKVYATEEDVRKVHGGIDQLNDLYVKLQGEDCAEFITAFFTPPAEDFTPNTAEGQCAGTITLCAKAPLGTIIHEAVHAGHCYSSIAFEANREKGVLDQDELHEWYEEALATCVESVATGIAKLFGHGG